jgi:pimeloyl-ACP methyl ester carboxylesterase
MSKVQHLINGSYAGQVWGHSIVTPNTIDPEITYLQIVVIPGQGEAKNNLGDEASLERTYNLGMFSFLIAAVDLYPIILNFVNTTEESTGKNGEVQAAVKYLESKYKTHLNSVVLFGHSLGSYIIGNFVLTDSEFAKKVILWAASASGPFTSRAILWQNIADNNIIAIGATALNDDSTAARPIHTQRIYDEVKKIKPGAHIIIFEYPATLYPDKSKAHNNMCGRLSGLRVSDAGFNSVAKVRGGELTHDVIMNMYEFALSNLKGTPYISPEHPYKEAPPVVIVPPVTEVPPPVGTTRTVQGINVSGKNVKVQIVYKDAPVNNLEFIGTNVWIPGVFPLPVTMTLPAGKGPKRIKIE